MANIRVSGDMRTLTIAANEDEREELRERSEAHDESLAWLEFIGPLEANGRVYQIDPATIGALTEAPLLAFDVEYDDDGAAWPVGAVYWFPNYMIESFVGQLIETGAVEFVTGETMPD